METLLFTPTPNTTDYGTSQGNRGLIETPVLFQGENDPGSIGGFYFRIVAPVGAILTKEAAIAKEGLNLHCSKIANQLLFRKD